MSSNPTIIEDRDLAEHYRRLNDLSRIAAACDMPERTLMAQMINRMRDSMHAWATIQGEWEQTMEHFDECGEHGLYPKSPGHGCPTCEAHTEPDRFDIAIEADDRRYHASVDDLITREA